MNSLLRWNILVGAVVLAGRPIVADDTPLAALQAICVDEHGKTVAGAEVHLFQYKGSIARYLHFGPFTSDGEGKVTCPEALLSNDRGNFDRWVYARIPGRLVGVGRTAKWTNRAVINQEFKVQLRPARTIEGDVIVPPNFDCRNVVVQVRTLQVANGDGDLDFEGFPRDDQFPGLDDALPELFECHPDAEGTIRFTDIPARGRLYLVTRGDGLGEAQWRNDGKMVDQQIQITIEPESSVSGRVLSPDFKPVAGAKVTARLRSEGGGKNGIFFESSFRAEADKNGHFEIHGLPQRKITLSIEDPHKQWAFRPREDQLPWPDEPRKRLVLMEPAILVTGRVLDPDGKPVEGAGFSAVVDGNAGAGLDDDMTDNSGRYRLHLPAGAANLYFNSLPNGFVYPEPQIVKRLEIESGQGAIENLDFSVIRAR
jgi:hypothetical protein